MKLQLLLADDDIDDCDFFRDALDEINDTVSLTVVNNGVELMDFLTAQKDTYPDLLFLDLNMPKKSGMECIAEIKASNHLSAIPIIVFSTSLDKSVVDKMFDLGVHHYIQKPGQFSSLKSVITKALSLFNNTTVAPPSIDQFIIQP